MINERFSQAAFAQLGIDTDASRQLANLLRDEIQRELHTTTELRLKKLIDELNSMGHQLTLEYPPVPGDISYRDESKSETGCQCRLRVGVDTVVSTGYSHLIDTGELDKEFGRAGPQK